MNQPGVYGSLLNLPSHPHPHPHPTSLHHHRAPSWAPCAVQQLPASYLLALPAHFLSPWSPPVAPTALTSIWSLYHSWTLLLRPAVVTNHPSGVTRKAKPSFPLVIRKEKGGPFSGESGSLRISCKTLLPMGAFSWEQEWQNQRAKWVPVLPLTSFWIPFSRMSPQRSGCSQVMPTSWTVIDSFCLSVN